MELCRKEIFSINKTISKRDFSEGEDSLKNSSVASPVVDSSIKKRRKYTKAKKAFDSKYLKGTREIKKSRTSSENDINMSDITQLEDSKSEISDVKMNSVKISEISLSLLSIAGISGCSKTPTLASRNRSHSEVCGYIIPSFLNDKRHSDSNLSTYKNSTETASQNHNLILENKELYLLNLNGSNNGNNYYCNGTSNDCKIEDFNEDIYFKF